MFGAMSVQIPCILVKPDVEGYAPWHSSAQKAQKLHRCVCGSQTAACATLADTV